MSTVEKSIVLANGSQIKIRILDSVIVDHVIDGLARAYGFQLRTGQDLATPPNAELQRQLTKVY